MTEALHILADPDRVAGFTIYNVLGEAVFIEKTENNVVWDRKNNLGVPVPSGSYMVRIQTERGNYIRKITVGK